MPTPPEILDLLSDAVIVVDRHGRLLFASRAAEPLFGYRSEELLGSHMIEHVHPDDRGATLSSIWRVMQGEQPVQFDNRWRHKDGHDVAVQWASRWSEKYQVRIAIARVPAETPAPG